MMTDIGEVAAAAEIQSIHETNEREIEMQFSKATDQLAKGLLLMYQPSLETVKKELEDLTSKQEALLVHMQIENKKIQDMQEDAELNEMFSTVGAYQEKLANIKRNMFSIHERTIKLKKRAIRLQQLKEKELLKKEHN